jgi:hypothetical protein
MEIVKNGICLQEKEISDRCAICRSKLILCVYKYQSKKLKKVVRCKKCQTATRIE